MSAAIIRKLVFVATILFCGIAFSTFFVSEADAYSRYLFVRDDFLAGSDAIQLLSIYSSPEKNERWQFGVNYLREPGVAAVQQRVYSRDGGGAMKLVETHELGAWPLQSIFRQRSYSWREAFGISGIVVVICTIGSLCVALRSHKWPRAASFASKFVLAPSYVGFASSFFRVAEIARQLLHPGLYCDRGDAVILATIPGLLGLAGSLFVGAIALVFWIYKSRTAPNRTSSRRLA